MFEYTFSRCTGLTKIPAGLFSGISGAPAKRMFWFTFAGCDSLTSIPENLFSGIQGAPAENMFNGTFYQCISLTGTITPNFFGNITPQITQEYLNSELTFGATDITYQTTNN
jgi:hypothetical protein